MVSDDPESFADLDGHARWFVFRSSAAVGSYLASKAGELYYHSQEMDAAKGVLQG